MKYFNLHANCIPVLGAKNAIICDVFRERYVQVPLEVAGLLEKDRTISLLHDDPDILELAKVLEQDDWGHYTDSPELFPPISLAYDYAGKISNCIIDVQDVLMYPIEKLVEQLNDLGCLGVQIRFFTPVNVSYINGVVSAFTDSDIRFIELVLQYDAVQYSKEHLTRELFHHYRLKNVYFFSSPFDDVVVFNKENSRHVVKAIYSTAPFSSERDCGSISEHNFSVNLQHFTEAKNFNSCLNCKLSVDKNGDIGNCPSMKQRFGSINTVGLRDAISHPSFWVNPGIKKDDVSVCKDCEYRYICVDCRAYTQNEHDPYAKPAKCSYNPYEGEWE